MKLLPVLGGYNIYHPNLISNFDFLSILPEKLLDHRYYYIRKIDSGTNQYEVASIDHSPILSTDLVLIVEGHTVVFDPDSYSGGIPSGYVLKLTKSSSDSFENIFRLEVVN